VSFVEDLSQASARPGRWGRHRCCTAPTWRRERPQLVRAHCWRSLPDPVAGRAQVLPRLVDALLHPDASPAAEPALRRGILAAISKVRRPARRPRQHRSRRPPPRVQRHGGCRVLTCGCPRRNTAAPSSERRRGRVGAEAPGARRARADAVRGCGDARRGAGRGARRSGRAAARRAAARRAAGRAGGVRLGQAQARRAGARGGRRGAQGAEGADGRASLVSVTVRWLCCKARPNRVQPARARAVAAPCRISLASERVPAAPALAFKM